MAEAKTVTVACGLPHGLIMELSPRPPSKIGDAPIRSPFPGVRFTLKGTHQVAREQDHFEARPGTPFGLTHGIPADFWKAWHEAHKDCDFVVKGLITANEDPARAADAAKENKAQKSVEKLDPDKLLPGDADDAKKAGRIAVEDENTD